MRVSVLGEGAWGTAVASLLAHNGHEVLLWCYQEASAHEIAQRKTNSRYAPGVILSQNIVPTTDLRHAVHGIPVIFEAIPIAYLRSVLQQVADLISADQTWVLLSKGIEQQTLMIPSKIMADVCSTMPQIVIVSGPSFANDVLEKQLTAVVVAAYDKAQSKVVIELLENHYFNTMFSSDVIGVQLVAAYKNVIALGVGILDGAGYSDNTKALFVVSMMQEIAAFVQKQGGQLTTLYSLAGLGDILLTAYGTQSKNVRVGRAIGQGASLSQIAQETGIIAEGINTLHALQQLVQQQEYEKLPLTMELYRVVCEGKSVQSLINILSIAYPLS